MSDKKVNVKISQKLLEKLMECIDDLDIGNELIEIDEENEEEEEVNNFVEVKKVLDYKVTDTYDFIFKLRFSNGQVEWVNDVDCNCELLISKFLKEKGVETIYLICRVSTKKQTECTSTSLEGQEAELRKQFGKSKQRIKVYKISSSAYKNVPTLLKYIGKCANKGDSMWVWRVDRLSRNIVTYLDWLENLHKKGVEINAYSEKLNYGSNKLDFIQKIVDAQKESHAIGERIKLSYNRKRARGDEAVGGLPYGKKYQKILSNDKKTVKRKVVVVNKRENDIIKMIKNSKKSDRELLEELSKKNIKKRGKKWNLGMIRRIRRNR